MTSESNQEPGSKRFARLEAIPPHERPLRGLKGAAASFYIARKRTVPATAGALVAVSIAGMTLPFLLPDDRGTAPAPAPVVDMARTLQEEVPALPVMPSAEMLAKPASVGPEGTAAVANTDGREVTSPLPALADPAAPTDADDEGETPPVRMIIPVAEAMHPIKVAPSSDDSGLTKVPDELAPAGPVKAAAETAVTPTASALPLPVERIPSEAELEDFFRMPAKDGAVEAPVETMAEEDMSPTVALPEAGPMPSTRPNPPISVLASGRVEFRIVQGPGIKSGFWLGNREDPKTRRFFVVVAPYLDDGSKTSWKFTNIADAAKVDTDRMAVEVTEDAFAALAAETKAHGKVRQPVLGVGEIGKEKIAWNIASEGNLLAGWDKEEK